MRSDGEFVDQEEEETREAVKQPGQGGGDGDDGVEVRLEDGSGVPRAGPGQLLRLVLMITRR